MPEPDMPLSLDEWMQAAPRLETDWDPLRRTYHRSLLDLAALRFRPLDRLTWSLPAGSGAASSRRLDIGAPVEYPDASRPQAFAAGAPLLALRTLLGLDVVDGEVVSERDVPESLGSLELHGVVRGRRTDVES